MKKHLVAASAIALMTATSAYAASGQKLSQADCDALWMQASPSGAATINETPATGYVTDFKAANPDNDGTIDKAEFAKACKMGLVSGSASSGSGSGASGADGSAKQ